MPDDALCFRRFLHVLVGGRRPEAVSKVRVPAGLAVAEGKRVTCRLIVLLCNNGL